MKTKLPRSSFSIGKLYCSFFGHDHVLSKNVTEHIKEYTCCHCKQQVTTNSQGNLEELTPKLKEINDLIATVHAKKMAKYAGSSNNPPYSVAS